MTVSNVVPFKPQGTPNEAPPKVDAQSIELVRAIGALETAATQVTLANTLFMNIFVTTMVEAMRVARDPGEAGKAIGQICTDVKDHFEREIARATVEINAKLGLPQP
jgi:hypothetical protein